MNDFALRWHRLSTFSHRILGAHNEREHTKGFTLLEVLVSLAVVSIFLGSTINLISTGFQNYEFARAQLQTEQVASAILYEYVITDALIGTSGVYKDKWVWEIDSQSYTPKISWSFESFPISKFKELTVNVQIKDRSDVTASKSLIFAD
jgi:prepilin-type N-terminal cleavage/methylation domain-containing protein